MGRSLKRTRIYLDANVFITAYESRGTRSDSAWEILNAVERDEFFAVTSELTLAEALVGPIQKGDDELAGYYHEILSSASEFEVAAVERRVLIEAATLRAVTRSLRMPDAIHVATARLHDCQFLVSDDLRLPNAPGLSFVRLGAQALEHMRDVYR
jgi:predicted nucleic acid-binding protein